MVDDWESAAKAAGGLSAIGAAVYGALRMLKSDRREDKSADTKDDAMMQVIQTLREEIARLSERLEKVEEQNADCQEKNAHMAAEIIALKSQMKAAA